MNERGDQLSEKAQVALQTFFAKQRLAHASELAQSGRYLEAEGVLTHNGRVPDSPEELDLLARIAGQRGHFDKAERYWTIAQGRGLNSAECQTAIQGIDQARKSQDLRKRVIAISVVAAAIATIVALLLILLPLDTTPSTRPVTPSVDLTTLKQSKSEPPIQPIVIKLPEPLPKPAER